MTREEAIKFIAQSVKSDIDMAKVADAIKTIEQEPIKNDLGVEKIEVRKPCINYEDGCEEWAGCPCVHFKGRM